MSAGRMILEPYWFCSRGNFCIVLDQGRPNDLTCQETTLSSALFEQLIAGNLGNR